MAWRRLECACGSDHGVRILEGPPWSPTKERMKEAKISERDRRLQELKEKHAPFLKAAKVKWEEGV